MNWNKIEELTKKIIVSKLGISPEELSLDATFTDLGADSLDTVELIMEFEKEFDYSISDEIAESMSTSSDVIRFFIKNLDFELDGKTIQNKVISFKVREDGYIEVGLQTSDGSWVYADGTEMLPSGIYNTVFNRWSEILKELEEMINSPSVEEDDLQKYFEKYPELLKGDEYDLIIPQATIIGKKDSPWRADFVLRPFDQVNFCKILELKMPKADSFRKERSSHPVFYKQLHESIRQVKDYYRAFHSEKTRELFKHKYGFEVFEPDLQLIVGRKWDIEHIKYLQEIQKDNGLKITDWDTTLERLKRKFG